MPRLIALLFAGALLLTACGQAAIGAPSQVPDNPSQPVAELAKDAGSGSFSVGYVPPGFSLMSAAHDKPSSSESVATPSVLQLTSETPAERTAPTDHLDFAAVRTIFVVVDPVTPSEAATSTTEPGKKTDVEIRGREAKVVHKESSTSVKWSERPGLEIQVTGHGVEEKELLKVAANLHEKNEKK